MGLAQKLFLEVAKESTAPWKGIKSSAQKWPILETLLQAKRLSFVDFALAQRLLKSAAKQSEAAAALICHLSLAARQGHLCISIVGNLVHPPVSSVWIAHNDPQETILQEPEEAMLQAITDLIVTGARELPSQLLYEFANTIDRELFFRHPPPIAPICKQDTRYYLQRYWVLESYFLKNLLPLLSQGTSPALQLDETAIHAKVAKLLEHRQLLPEQAKAVINGCMHSLTVITGGPGTGKTHTAGILLRTLWEGLTLEQRSTCRIALTAPTGKAAATLEGSIRRALQDAEGFPIPAAQTLHTLLGIGKKRHQSSSIMLPYDVLLIDESSMIDVRVMGSLLAAIKPGARIIMLGDSCQLPPVEAGSVFADLVTLLQTSQGSFQGLAELKTCLRTELKTIVDLAAHINQGRHNDADALLKQSAENSGIGFTPLDKNLSSNQLQKQLLLYSKDKFPYIDSISNPLEALHAFSQFRILTPLRKGCFGVDTLNALFLQIAIHRARQKHASLFIAPIMIVKNDHRQELSNGEVGVLVQSLSTIDSKTSSGTSLSKSYAIFMSKAANNNTLQTRRIPALMLPKYEYAYCLSVHKSQGSEFDHVVMLLPEGSEHFGREVLYTGVTRARKTLEIWSSPETFAQTITQVSRRHSGILQRYRTTNH